MIRFLKTLSAIATVICCCTPIASADPPSFARLVPIQPSPRVVAAAEGYPGGHFAAGQLVDGDTRTEFASSSKGKDTFVEFDFGDPVRIAAFKHVDRRDRATVAARSLRCSAQAGLR